LTVTSTKPRARSTALAAAGLKSVEAAAAQAVEQEDGFVAGFLVRGVDLLLQAAAQFIGSIMQAHLQPADQGQR
jgi:hypothetical protein